MKLKLCSFNEEGIEKFHKYLNEVKLGTYSTTPNNLITDKSICIEKSNEVEIEDIAFKSKLDVAKYLNQKIEEAGIEEPYSDIGLWSWLAAFYFDQVCPLKNGKRKVGQDARYILAPGWNRIYRHLLAGPAMMYAFHEENAILMLYGALDEMGDFVEQLMSRQEIAQNKNLIGLSRKIYWNEKEGKPVKGVRLKERKPGTLRRFIDVIQQLDLNYDLYSMTPEEIIGILPSEFHKYIEKV